ncbi:MAG: hypothetical protein ABIJ97_03035 [Bacteroidota bacterium]
MKNQNKKLILNKILMGTGITAISNMESVISFSQRVFAFITPDKSNIEAVASQQIVNQSAFETADIYRIIGILATFILAWIILGRLNQLKNRTNENMEIFSIIMYQKAREIVKNNIPDIDEYNKYLVREFIETRKLVYKNFPKKTTEEINEIMFKYYPDEVKNRLTRK